MIRSTVGGSAISPVCWNGPTGWGRLAELESGLAELHELRRALSMGQYPAVDVHGGRRLAAVRSPG